jgi:spore germination protein
MAREYYEFLKLLTGTMNPLGYDVTVALAPKTSDDQGGRLTGGHDYALIGSVANAVLLMTYEWGYTYGPPRPVAPLDKVAEVVRYAVSRISPDKIYMGIPLYGYDWTLPYKEGTKAQSISSFEAVEIAAKNNAAIEFDRQAMSPFFTYVDSNGSEHIVWFEDARSIEAKLALANRYRLKGTGYWSAGRHFPQNWLVLNALYQIAQI